MSRADISGAGWSTTDEVQFVKHLGEFSLMTQKSPREKLLAKYFYAIRDRKKGEGDNVDWDHVRLVILNAISQYDLGEQLLEQVRVEFESKLLKVDGGRVTPREPIKTREEIGEEIRRREMGYLFSMYSGKYDYALEGSDYARVGQIQEED
jgi:hypothetical protein